MFIFGIVSLLIGFAAVVLRQPFGITATLPVGGSGLMWLARGIERGLRKLSDDAMQSRNIVTSTRQ